MARELKNIKTTEVSFVGEPAIKRKFLFFKSRGEGQGAGGEAQGDGGARYCVCPQCGYSETHEKAGEGKSVPCTEIKCPKCGAGMKGSNTKILKEKSIMDTELTGLLKEYFGEDIEIDVEKKEELSDKALDAVKGALKLINKYKADFPDDLKKAVGTLAKYAGYGYGYPAKKEEVSKAEPEPGQPNEPTSKTSDPSEIEKSIEELTKSIEKLEQEKNQQAQDEVSKTLEALSKRLEAVEKGTGIKKSVEGQDDDNTQHVNDPWPSIKITD